MGFFYNLPPYVPPLDARSTAEIEHMAVNHARSRRNRHRGVPERRKFFETSVPIYTSYLVPGGKWLLTMGEGSKLSCWDISGREQMNHEVVSRAEQKPGLYYLESSCQVYESGTEALFVALRKSW
jgi:hypothetical protein